MRNNPNSGYVLEADKLKHLFSNPTQIARFEELVDNGEYDELVSFCDRELKTNIPHPTSFFMLSDEDTADVDLEYNVLYAYFDEKDLYEFKKNDKMIQLEYLLGSGPTLHNWSIFG